MARRTKRLQSSRKKGGRLGTIGAIVGALFLLGICRQLLNPVEKGPAPVPTRVAQAVRTATSRPTVYRTATKTTAPLTATATVDAVSLDPTPPPTAPPSPSATPEPTVQPTPGSITVTFIDVGQGDAALVQAADATVLIDGGQDDSGIVEALRGRGVSKLDLVVASHPHADHIGGLAAVLHAFPVVAVATNGQPHTTTTYEAFLDAIAEAGAEYREVGRGDKLRAGSLQFEVLHPGHVSGDLNNDSLVLCLQHGSIGFLFAGDVQTEGEASMLWGGMPVRADVLKVSHHGSSSSSSVSFVSAVAPRVAVISCGAGNSYGPPHAETLAILQYVGADVYRTDQVGSVVIESDGSTYRVVTSLSQPRAPPMAATLAAPQPTEAPQAQSCPYIGNSNTGKFHLAGCRYVAQMSPANKVCLQSREQAISLGYIPCKVCAP